METNWKNSTHYLDYDIPSDSYIVYEKPFAAEITSFISYMEAIKWLQRSGLKWFDNTDGINE